MLPVGDELIVVLAGEPPALAGELLTGESLSVGWLGSVGVGGVLTITGVPFSAVGGVRGGLLVSTFWPRERRRNRSVGAVLEVSGTSADWLKSVFSEPFAFLLGSCLASDDDVVGRRSGLGLPVVLELAELFLVLKTSRNRPPGETDLFDCWRGGASSVLPVLSCGGGLRSSVASAGKVEDWGEDSDGCWSDVCEAEICSACTRGEFVVRYPIWDGCVEMAVGRVADLSGWVDC